MELTDRQKWFVVGTLTATVAGTAMRMLVRREWRRRLDRDAPRNPASPDTGWLDALLWTALTSLLAGVGSLVARRLAASAWRVSRGAWPPGLVDEDAA